MVQIDRYLKWGIKKTHLGTLIIIMFKNMFKKWGYFLSYPVKCVIISLVRLEISRDSLVVAFSGTERGNAMSLDNVLTLLLVLFSALTYLDNRNNHKK